MDIISSDNLKKFLADLTVRAEYNLYPVIPQELAEKTLVLFGTESNFKAAYGEYKVNADYKDAMAFLEATTTSNINFFKAVRADVLSYADKTREAQSYINSLLGYIETSVYDMGYHNFGIDQLAQVMYCPIENLPAPVEIDKNNPFHCAYAALSCWAVRLCVVWLLKAYKSYMGCLDGNQGVSGKPDAMAWLIEQGVIYNADSSPATDSTKKRYLLADKFRATISMRGVLNEAQKHQADDWVAIHSFSNGWEKYGRSMFSPSLGRLRAMTIDEFYNVSRAA